MARPKQVEELKKLHKVTIRFSASEMGRLTSDTEKLGVTLSAYIRAKALRGYIHVPKYAKIDCEHIGQLSKLGGLLKLTHAETGGIYSDKTAAILDEIRTILVIVKQRLESDDRQTHTQP